MYWHRLNAARPAFVWPVVCALACAAVATACADECPSEPLAPLVEAPRWIVRVNAWPQTEEAEPTLPGTEAVADPPGFGTYAAFSLHGASGAVLSDRWIDSRVALEGIDARVDAAAALPTEAPSDRLTLLLAGGGRPLVSFHMPASTVAAQSTPWPAPPASGGQLLDLIELGDGAAVANRREAPDGQAGDLVVLDLEDGGPVRTIALDGLSTGGAQPATIAALAEERILAGLSLPEERDAGAVAVIDVGTGAALRFDVPRLSGCSIVATFPSNRSRAAVLCTGDLSLPSAERRGAGLALLSIEGGAAPRVLATHLAETLDPSRLPTGPIAALRSDWVAVVSRAEPASGRPDALMAIHLPSGTTRLLFEEQRTDLFGDALGSGDFADDLGELWWPAATSGLLRWQMTGADASATFTPLEVAPAQGCSRLPPRVVRALRVAAPDPAGPDAGVDAGIGAEADAGTDAGADAGVDAPADAGSETAVDAGAETGLDAGVTP